MATGTESIDPVELLIAEPWRLEPHDFAQEISGGTWHAWNYLAYIGQRITDAVARGDGRLIVNMPPGHGKSEFLSHWTPTWFLDNLPDRRLILASHGAELAAHWGRIVRNEFEHNERLTTRLRADSSAADRWNTPQGGGMKTAGVGGGLTGWRGDLILIDDPHPSWEAVNSQTHRQRVAEWIDGTLLDRAEPDATIILLMHRWHVDDAVGHLEAKGGWEIIRMPALAETGDILGRREGEALCPDRFDVNALLSIKRAVGSLVWSGKYRQSPTPAGGNYFKREWFEIIERNRVPRLERSARVWDLAATAEDEGGDPDELAGVKMGRDAAGDYYILHVHHDKVSPAGVQSAIRQFAMTDGHDCMIRVEQEGAASGKIVKYHYTRMLDGWDARFNPIPRSSKFTRSGAFNAACERRQVKLVAGEWNEAFLDQAAVFPNGTHDDMVDAAVGAYEALTRPGEGWDGEDFARLLGGQQQRPMTPRERLLQKIRNSKR